MLQRVNRSFMTFVFVVSHKASEKIKDTEDIPLLYRLKRFIPSLYASMAKKKKKVLAKMVALRGLQSSTKHYQQHCYIQISLNCQKRMD